MYFSLNRFTQDLLERYAREAAPHEAVGLLRVQFNRRDWTKIESTDLVMALQNHSTTPASHFLIFQAEVNKARYWFFKDYAHKVPLWLWHTHPHGPPSLSREDQMVLFESTMPMLVVGLHPHLAFRVYSMGRPRPADGKRPIYEVPMIVEES